MPSKKTPSTKPTTKKSTTKKASAKKASQKNATAESSARMAPNPRPGDVIVIDSVQVGSAAREGEIVQVIEREASISFRVRWSDGHETLISPGAGAAHIIRR